MAPRDCITAPPGEVAARPAPRVPSFDPTLGVAVDRDHAGEPTHPLVAVGDSLTQGFQSGAIHNTHLSYPALIARELGSYDRFQHPSYDRFGGLPLNIEYVVRELEERFGDRISPWELPFAGLKVRDLMDEIEDSPGEGDGIETLIVLLGANNALGTVTELRACWSARSSYDDPDAKRHYTVWDPAHFREELTRVVETARTIRARHVIWGTVPHVTIAPIARGIGSKVSDGSRYFPFYARPWVTDERFDPGKHEHLTAAQARAIDTAIDLYNEAIEDAVRAARKAGLDWLLLDVCGLLDRLAARRYIEDEASRPDWWTPYPLPQPLRALSPAPDSRFLTVDPRRGRTAGGLFSLDGVHPTTIMYGLMAQEFIKVMEVAGVQFHGSARPGPVQIDFAALIRRDSLISDPPRSLSGDLELIAWLDDRAGFFKRLLSKGP